MSLATAPEPYRVGPETIAAYDRDGAVLPRGLADAGWIERVRDETGRVTNPSLQTGDRLDGPHYPVVHPA